MSDPLIGGSTSPSSAHLSNDEFQRPMSTQDCLSWWFMGILNNISFVIIAASAKDILPSAVGTLYLAESIPSLLVRISAPYWFDRVGPETRMFMCFCLYLGGFTLAALVDNIPLKLVGVCALSLQQGLGETTMLALSTRYGNKALTLWSSGTGAAGLLGYAYVIALRQGIKVSTRWVLLLSNILGVLYYIDFKLFKIPPPFKKPSEDFESKIYHNRPSIMSGWDRLRLTFSLWPWAVPLIVVFFAEYAMQSGTWGSIGFPVDDEDARSRFYQYAGLCYQGGVLISRSSGTVWKPSLPTLWIMPVIQLGVLVFSTLNASEHWWYSYSLLALSVFVGFLGGAVYVNGFRLIAVGVDKEHVELATAAAAVSSDIGTNLGEAAGILIQKWLYSKNNIHDSR